MIFSKPANSNGRSSFSACAGVQYKLSYRDLMEMMAERGWRRQVNGWLWNFVVKAIVMPDIRLAYIVAIVSRPRLFPFPLEPAHGRGNARHARRRR